MSYNTVFSDAEYSIASNKLSSYSEFLLQTIKTYRETLTTLVEAGLKAQNIDIALMGHVAGAVAITAALDHLSEKEAKYPTRMEKALIQADDFSYPEGFLAAVSSLLASFL